MKKLICRLLRQDPDSREGIIAFTSALGILVNLLIAVCKVVLGALASSVAILSEGVNNASDALTSVLTLVGTRLAAKHPDKRHPFGYGRIEYLTGLVIAGLILFTGAELLVSSAKLIFQPAELSVSYLSLAAVALSAVVKFVLGVYTIRAGKRADSAALTAVGLDCRNDSFISVVTILSAVIFLVFDFSLDAFAGVFTSLIVLKAGIGVLSETVSALLGQAGDQELASALYEEIRRTDGILNAADMMLHNYGPDTYSGSVNVEIDHEKSVGEIYAILHALQLRIMHEHRVTMVFGVYAVDNDHAEVREIRRTVGAFVLEEEHVVSFHAVYLEPGTNRLYCDLVVDYALADWNALREKFLAYMTEHFPAYTVELTVETEFV